MRIKMRRKIPKTLDITIALEVLDVMTDIGDINKFKMRECADRYWDACKYPRKKKKKIRKEAQEEYAVWRLLDILAEHVKNNSIV
jgi:hypothetical protein